MGSRIFGTLPRRYPSRRALERLEVPDDIDPAAALQQLMMFRNERVLHRRKCDISGTPMISAYAPDVPFSVIRNDLWWGDSWDPYQYGRPFDFQRPFFEQFAELQHAVPREGTSVFNSENCDYTSHVRESRNCYLTSLSYRCEDTHYSYWTVNDKNVLDCFLVNNSELAYECLDGDNLYDCVYLQDCVNCRGCLFSYQLVGCEDCIGCSNLIHKRFWIGNRPASAEEYAAFRGRILDGSRRGWEEGEQLFREMWASTLHRTVHNLQCENVVGDHLKQCKNCYSCFDGVNSEDCAYSVSIADSKDILHSYSAGWPACELVYRSLVTRGSQDIAFCYYTFFGSDLRYCDSTVSCRSCFGCVGLKRGEFCILNRRYSEEEYRRLMAQILGHMKDTGEWGQFFPPSLSSFAYNESAAQDFFPLTPVGATELGLRWRESTPPQSAGLATPLAAESVGDLPESPDRWVLRCETSGKLFRLIQGEVDFYRRFSIPLPRRAPEIRHRRRFERRNPLTIVSRTCCESGEEIFSSFTFDRPERVCSEGYFEQVRV